MNLTRFEEALEAFKETHGHRSWWEALENTLRALARDVDDSNGLTEYDSYGNS